MVDMDMAGIDDENVQVQLATMLGKLELITTMFGRMERDVAELRDEQKQQTRALAVISSLNIQERLTGHSDAFKAMDSRLKKLEEFRAEHHGEQRGAAKIVRFAYATCSLVSATAVAGFLRLVGVIGG